MQDYWDLINGTAGFGLRKISRYSLSFRAFSKPEIFSETFPN